MLLLDQVKSTKNLSDFDNLATSSSMYNARVRVKTGKTLPIAAMIFIFQPIGVVDSDQD